MTESNNCLVFRPSYEDYFTHKDFVEAVFKFVKMKNIMGICARKEKVLFLDDIDTMMLLDRYSTSFINELITMCKVNKDFKLLLTCSACQEKKVSDIKKKMIWCKVRNPPVAEAVAFLKHYIKECSIQKAYPDGLLEEYADAMQCNIRSMIMNMHLLSSSSLEITSEKVFKCTFDKNICDVASTIISLKDVDLATLDVLISSDPTLISFIAYDNKSRCIDASDPHAHSRIMQVVDAYANTAPLETVAYNKNDCFLSDIQNIYRMGTFKLNCRDVASSVKAEYTTIPTKASTYFIGLKRQRDIMSQYGLSEQNVYLASNLGILKASVTTDFLTTYKKKFGNFACGMSTSRMHTTCRC